MTKVIAKLLALLSCLLLAGIASAQPISTSTELIEKYAGFMLELSGDEARAGPLATLLEQAEINRDANPRHAAAWSALARIRVAYADTQGMGAGLRLLKTARNELEQAIALDPLAEGGLAQAFLGYLYAGVPPWPLSFRNKAKSEALFGEALDNTYVNASKHLLRAQVLVWYKDYGQAREQYQLALSAAETNPSTPNLKAWQSRGIERGLQALPD